MHDLRYAWRMLAKSPGFALTAILTLALAIGANTAVFTLVNAALIEPLPYARPDRLAYLARAYVRDGVRLPDVDTSHDGRVWEAVRDGVTSATAAVFSGTQARVNLVVGDRAISVRQNRVGAGYFGVLGVGPVVGREFSADEDRTDGPAVVMISQPLWRNVFNLRPDVVGQTMLLRGESHVVVGVMPEGFRGMAESDVWTPLRPSTRGEGGGQNYQIVLRLAPGMSWAQADVDMAAAIDPVLRRRQSDSGATITHGVIPLQEGLTTESRQPLLLLAAAVALVLAVAAVNLAGLLLARAGLRRREMATRLALGARRSVLLRQLLLESLVLAAIGGGLGLLLGALGVRALHALATDVFLASWVQPALDGRVLAVTALVTLATGVAFGLVPALQASRVDVQTALAEGGTRSIAVSGGGWPRRMLVVAEVALGVVLLVGAGLLIRTFVHLQTLEPGFDPTNLVTASASMDDARYRDQALVTRLIDRSLERVRALPGVASAAVSLGLPYQRILNIGFSIVGRDGQVTGAPRATTATYVSDGYFEALGIPLRRGRRLDAGDSAAAAPVVVVNDAFAREYLDDGDPLGRVIALSNAPRQIVGVVGNVQQAGSFGGYGPLAALPTVYMPAAQVSSAFMNLAHTWFAPAWIIRQEAPGMITEPMLRQVMAGVDPQLPWASISDIAAEQATALGRQRLLMTLVGLLGAAALLLAAVGIHGLVASGVTERTRELGIRMALGATVEQAMRTAALPGIALTGAGVAIGSGMAYAASSLIRSLLWGVREDDILTFIAVDVLLLAVAVVASVVPVLRVRRMDPIVLLRE